ncbi:TonB family protein [Gammaproteobacteria bacterium]|nr:TonB family protein [Gammaproteobacteria bacterium]
MSSLKSYSIGLVVSVFIHGNILAALVFAWEPKESPVIITPNQIEASLVQLTANPKVSEDVKVQKKQKKKSNKVLKPVVQKEKSQVSTAPKTIQTSVDEISQRKIESTSKPLNSEKERFLRRTEIENEFEESLLRESEMLKQREEELAANSFRRLIQKRLSDNWSRPPSARLGMQATLRLNLVPTGRIVGIAIISSSGDQAFDRSVEQAASKAGYFEDIDSMSAKMFEQSFRTIEVLFSPEDLRL